jgi:LmbE family N-acetylglucosaminyl deacetylase
MTHAVAAIAHFDDAIIWAGGAIRRTRALGWDWTVVCMCAAEPARRTYFLESCAALDVRGVALEFIDHPDQGPFSHNNRDAMAAALRDAVGTGSSDWLFTHNGDGEGEYGPHPNHAEIASVVSDLVEKRLVRPRGVAQFAYRRLYRAPSLSSVARVEATRYLQLDYDGLAWKTDWCARARDVEVHDPTLGGVSWLEKLGWPCPNPEAFVGGGLALPPPFSLSR